MRSDDEFIASSSEEEEIVYKPRKRARKGGVHPLRRLGKLFLNAKESMIAEDTEAIVEIIQNLLEKNQASILKRIKDRDFDDVEGGEEFSIVVGDVPKEMDKYMKCIEIWESSVYEYMQEQDVEILFRDGKVILNI